MDPMCGPSTSPQLTTRIPSFLCRLFKTIQSKTTFSEPAIETNADVGSHRLLASSRLAKVSLAIEVLPIEIILMIASKLSVSAQASFSLSCKRFFYTLPAGFGGLKMPAEQPFDFQELGMSKPQLYRPDRWGFLRLLEKDLSSEWSLCSDCFVLRPAHMFADYETSVVPWLKNFYRSKGFKTRSCLHSLSSAASPEISYSPCGVVDLCPCIKLTPGKKRAIQANLRAVPQGLNKHSWWHQCRSANKNQCVLVCSHWRTRSCP